MRRIFTLCLLLAIFSGTKAQEKNIAKITDSLVTEGRALYQSEIASWYGTDAFVEKCKDKLALSGGYLSYDTGDGETNIFFSKGDSPKILATISFEKQFNARVYKFDTTSRALTKQENELVTIRQKALAEVNRDTIFKRYKNTDLNLIPLISNGVKKVYILTGPQQNGLVILGNDYLLTFNDRNEIISKKRLHKGVFFFKKDPQNTAESAVHSHVTETGDFITATDICTLMLYERSAGWKFHVVISANYVSSWNCERNQLVILTKQAWENIAKSQTENKN